MLNKHSTTRVVEPWTAEVFRRLSRIRVPMSSDALVRQLHGRDIQCCGESWQIDVYSIFDDDSDRWIQIGLRGTAARTVLLKLSRFADDVDAVDAIQHWIRKSPSPHSGVLTVTASN
jgi:hypothetical protein